VDLMRALIVGHDTLGARNVLAAVRSLGRAGYEVGVGSPVPGLSSSSRYATRWHPVPSPAVDADAFRAAVRAAVQNEGYDILFPGGDAEVLALTMWRDDFEAIVPYASYADCRRALDKLAVQPYAEAAGLAIPLTAHGDDEHALGGMPYPVIVKARLHWTPGALAAPNRLEVALAQTPDVMRRQCDLIRRAGGEPFVQQWLPGTHLTHNAVLDAGGNAVLAFQQATRWTWPPGAGVWTRAEICSYDAEFGARCNRFLASLGWHGLVQLQFLVPEDGVPRLVDLNGRFYASLGLAMAGGADLPMIWARMALGEPVRTTRPPAAGLRYQWFEGDIQRAMVQAEGGRFHDIVSCLRYRRGAVHSLWASDDPKPTIFRLSKATRSAPNWIRLARSGTARRTKEVR